MKLPFYILKSLQDSKTSLGQHPSYPPDEEDSFIIGTVSDYFNHLSDGIVYNDIDELKGNLSSLITKAKKIENSNIDALEKKSEKDYYSTSVWKSISYDMRKEHEIC